MLMFKVYLALLVGGLLVMGTLLPGTLKLLEAHYSVLAGAP